MTMWNYKNKGNERDASTSRPVEPMKASFISSAQSTDLSKKFP